MIGNTLDKPVNRKPAGVLLFLNYCSSYTNESEIGSCTLARVGPLMLAYAECKQRL